MKNIAILSLILLSAAATSSPAATLLVPSQYPNIQAGIDAANDGDTVIIAPGVYTGQGEGDTFRLHIRFKGKAITVRSVDPNDPAIVAATIVDCSKPPPQSQWPNGGFWFDWPEDANSVLDGLTIINGSGGIICNNSTPTIRNCVIRNCLGQGIYCMYSAPTIKNCVISHCTGGGIYCHDGLDLVDGFEYYPEIINCTISNNTTNAEGGGIYCYQSSPIITNCTISNNIADGLYGGGIYYYGMRNLAITNSIITGNYARFGGGICGTYSLYNDGRMTLVNCVISGNRAQINGGGVYRDKSRNLIITNSTIAANVAGQSGGGVFSNLLFMSHNILWANVDNSGSGQSAQITIPAYDPTGDWYKLDIAYNCIQDVNANDTDIPFDELDSHNIDDDPKFVRNPDDGGDGWGDDPATPDVDEGANDDFGDLHLRKDSPCINAGLPNYFAGAAVDIDGQPRIIGTLVDMGADEYAPMIVTIEPKGDEVWAGASSHEIKWDCFGINGKVNISYSSNGGANWKQIGTSDASAESFLWLIPNGIDSNQCLISVVPSIPDTSVISINSGVFSINSFKPWPGKQPNAKAVPKIGPKQACVKWQFETGGSVTAAVTVQNNKAYIACEDGKLYVLDASSGLLLWSYDAKAPLIASAGVSHNGMVYAADSRGNLHAINKLGQLEWTQNTYGPIHSTPIVARNGNIYLCSEDGTLYALSQNGSELWCFDTAGLGLLGGSIFATPQIADDETIYLAGLYDPNLYAVNPADGCIKWACNFGPTNGWPFAAPAFAEDGVLYQTLLYDCNMYAIEPQHGQIIWSVNIADPCSGWFEPLPVTWEEWFWDPVKNDWEVVVHHDVSYEYLKYSCGWSPPVVGPDGTIYVNVAGAYLEAVNPDGTIKWAKKIGEVGGLTLTIDKKGLIYAASDDRHLYIINPDGEVISEFTGQGWLSWPVIAKARMLIISDANNMVWALSDEACGSPLPANINQKGKK